MPSVLAMSLSDLELGTPHIHSGLCLVPLLTRRIPVPRYLTMLEA
jgi:hypothetical protein